MRRRRRDVLHTFPVTEDAHVGRNLVVFVVGCERSGTTLLRTMLDSHQRLAIPPESYFPLEWIRHADSLAPHGRPDLGRLAERLSRDDRFRRWELNSSDVELQWIADRPIDLPSAIRSVFRCYALREGKELFGDKTPSFVTGIPELAKAFPESRFIHIVRDGRDVALSLVDRKHQPPHTLPDGAIFWAKRVQQGQSGGSRIGANRYRAIRYEDLVDGPESMLRSLCAFLSLPFDPEMLAYSGRGARAAAYFDFPEFHTHLTRPPTKGLRDWRRTMSRHDQELVQSLCGDVLRQFGYVPVSVPTSGTRQAVLRLRAIGAKTGFRVRSRGRRLRLRAKETSSRFRTLWGSVRPA